MLDPTLRSYFHPSPSIITASLLGLHTISAAPKLKSEKWFEHIHGQTGNYDVRQGSPTAQLR